MVRNTHAPDAPLHQPNILFGGGAWRVLQTNTAARPSGELAVAGDRQGAIWHRAIVSDSGRPTGRVRP
jgi:hypothetical protein